MDNILYLECSSGISGDMAVAALLDLGADQKVLERVLASLPVQGFETCISRVKKSGLDVCDFKVVLDEAHENHDADMEYLHGDGAPGGHTHDHSHGRHVHEHSHETHQQEHRHGAGHTHSHSHDHTHEHRGLPEILHILAHTQMTEKARELAIRIFRILAEAESKAHGLPVEQVHFHEVGAVDSIVDIVAVAVCLDNLGIHEVAVPSLCEGHGTIRCQHGIIPVPVPAVVHIASSYNLVLKPINTEGELVTPTGAAIVAAICTRKTLPETYRIARTGMGAGKREYNRPSLLRAMILQAVEEKKTDVIVKLESNIDDCSGEALGYVMERLLAAGARDVHYTPVFMKKNRPAYQLNVICREEDRQALEQIIFAETTTIGIRRMTMERTVLEREIVTFRSSLGEVQMKVCTGEGIRKGYPEYESLKSICRKQNISYIDAYAKVMSEWQ